MLDKKITYQFTLLTFSIAYLVSFILIILGQFGYSTFSVVQSLQELLMNIPFAIYILSPAIASFIILKKNNKIKNFHEWLKVVFYAKNRISRYIFIIVGLLIYFLSHILISGRNEAALPAYMFLLSLPGNLIIGGLEEAGWMYILQPTLDKKIGFIYSSILVGLIWILWHIPLFFIPGTAHYEGLIDFGMFSVQVISFRFFYGAIYKISGKGYIFLCVLFHTMFNAATPVSGILPMSWMATIVANSALIIFAIVSVKIYDKRNRYIK